jgi:hypothetical protein
MTFLKPHHRFIFPSSSPSFFLNVLLQFLISSPAGFGFSDGSYSIKSYHAPPPPPPAPPPDLPPLLNPLPPPEDVA